jgi:hypothetical protein
VGAMTVKSQFAEVSGDRDGRGRHRRSAFAGPSDPQQAREAPTGQALWRICKASLRITRERSGLRVAFTSAGSSPGFARYYRTLRPDRVEDTTRTMSCCLGGSFGRRAYRDRRCGTCRLHDAVGDVRTRPAIRCGLGGQANHAFAQCNCRSTRVAVAHVRCGFRARSGSPRRLRGRGRQRRLRHMPPRTRARLSQPHRRHRVAASVNAESWPLVTESASMRVAS